MTILITYLLYHFNNSLNINTTHISSLEIRTYALALLRVSYDLTNIHMSSDNSDQCI